MEFNILNEKFESNRTESIDFDVSKDLISESVVHQVIVALLANKRSGTASTKSKGLVQGGGKKPFKQKGSGRSRQGSERSPLMPGGGVVFGPTPRDFSKKINKKMMRRAIQSVLIDKYLSGKLFLVERFADHLKTKDVSVNLDQKKITPCLLVTSSENIELSRAARNIRNVSCLPGHGFSVYEAVKFENLVLEVDAFKKLVSRVLL
jgi:large subunit ribosomal protein L4